MFEQAGTVFAGTPDWAAQSEEQEKQILVCQFSSHVGRWFPATIRHRGNKGGSKNQSIYVVPPLLASNTRAVYTHTHRRTNTLAHRLRAVRGNVLPYNRGYSINKLRECQIDYFFSLTVSHPSAQAYVDTHADTSTHSHCPAPPPPPECSQSASKIKL